MKKLIYKIWYYFHSAIHHKKIIEQIKEEGLAMPENNQYTGMGRHTICEICWKEYEEIAEENKLILDERDDS